jgi:hypothetical protein
MWMAEKGRLQSTVLVKKMLRISTQLEDIAETLGSHETRMHSARDIEVVSQSAEWLALDPGVGSIEKANERRDHKRVHPGRSISALPT